MESGSVLDEVSNHLHSLNAFRACEACLNLAICGLGQHGSVIALDESLLCPEVCRLLHIETIFSGLFLNSSGKGINLFPGLRSLFGKSCFLQQIAVDVENRAA